MKTKYLLLILLLLAAIGFTNAQDTSKAGLIDLKLELLDTKLELLQMKIEAFNKRISEMNMNAGKIDSLIKAMEEPVLNPAPENVPEPFASEDIYQPQNYKYSMRLNPIRLFEGTFQFSYERVFSENFSVDLSVLGTYATKEGIGGGYMNKQELNTLQDGLSVSYQGQLFAGAGGIVQPKFFLLAKEENYPKAPAGLYASPFLLYRYVEISGYIYDYLQDIDNRQKEITSYLHVVSLGATIGYKFTFSKVLCIDLYAGGVFRLGKYTDEKTFTRYKQWNNIDYSGVLPTVGISIGLLK